MSKTYVGLALTFFCLLSPGVQAQFCPASYHPHDRETIRDRYLSHELLALAHMHELALQVATYDAFSIIQIRALSENYSALLEETKSVWRGEGKGLHWNSRRWIRNVAERGFPTLNETRLDGDDIPTAKANSITALRVLSSAVSEIAGCF